MENILTLVWAEQSVQCAVMQHTIAVGCLDVRPVLTNTRMVNPPIMPDIYYPVGSVTKKNGSLANGANHSSRMSLI
jgi:hypothetical protein